MARQLVRATEVRAPEALDDSLTESQLQQLASGSSTTVSTSEDFLNLVISKLKLIQGGDDWVDSAPPAPGIEETQSVNELLAGAYDGVGLVFTTANYYIPSTLSVTLNGVGIFEGNDYTTSESGGTGTGFDTVTLINRDNSAPLAWEQVRATYSRNL